MTAHAKVSLLIGALVCLNIAVYFARDLLG